jgi:fumarate reductase flavoprotein subunit
LRHKAAGANPELATAYRVQKMLKLALCVALRRSRSGPRAAARISARTFPRRDDAQWLKRTLASWKHERRHAADARLRAARRPVDGAAAGWRGYGAKDYVDHPDTAARAAEVLALRERLKEAPRFEVQHSLMPYDELLPHALRGRNERIDEPLS